MLTTYELVDRALYKSLSQPTTLNIVSCLLNYIFVIYSVSRASEHTANYMYCITAMLTCVITVALYNLVPCAAGMSTIWSLFYGLLVQRSHVDHAMFWLTCGSVIVPMYFDDYVCTFYDHSKLPHHQDWPFIATAAHLIFALLGFIVSLLMS